MRPGDRLSRLDGGESTLVALQGNDGRSTVYNFTVDQDHTYFVGTGGIWVHNSYFWERVKEFGKGLLHAAEDLLSLKWSHLGHDVYDVVHGATHAVTGPQRRETSGQGADITVYGYRQSAQNISNYYDPNQFDGPLLRSLKSAPWNFGIVEQSPKVTYMLSDGSVYTGTKAGANAEQAGIHFSSNLGRQLAGSQVFAYSAPLSVIADGLPLAFKAGLGVANGWSTAQMVKKQYDVTSSIADGTTSMIPYPSSPLVAVVAQSMLSDFLSQVINVIDGEKVDFSPGQLVVNTGTVGIAHADYQTPSSNPPRPIIRIN